MTQHLVFGTVKGETYELDATEEATVQELFQMLQEKYNIPAADCRLVFGGRPLQLEDKVRDFGLTSGSRLILHVRKQQVPTSPGVSGTSGDVPVDPTPQPKPIQPRAQLSQPPPPTAGPVDPANFHELVSQLAELGYDRAQCEAALRASHYNVEAAADSLLGGGGGSAGGAYIPDPPQYPTAGGGQFDVGMSGLGPQYDSPSGRFGALQSHYDGLTAQEKAAVDRLCQGGHDPATVLQCFIACDKNEENTKQLL